MAETKTLPPCGFYKTLRPIAGVPEGRLVYFHNHGDPGAGLYFPERWNHNRAVFAAQGTTLPSASDAAALQAIPSDGFYRVTKAFFCCEKECVRFEPEALVQLGYNGAAEPILFIPEFGADGIEVPERGTRIDESAYACISPLRIAERKDESRGIVIH